jgi:hypothetical protein
MKRLSQLLAVAAMALAPLAQAQSIDSEKSSKSATPKNDLAPSAPIRWSVRPVESSETQAATPDNVSAQGTQTVPAPPPGTELESATWVLPRVETERTQWNSGFPRSRLEFEQRFAPTRDYDNPFQQGVNQWFYRTNDLIFTWYGGFRQWQRDFESTVSHAVFGKSSSIPRDEEFWGQPRFKTKLDGSGATIRIDVPFGK